MQIILFSPHNVCAGKGLGAKQSDIFKNTYKITVVHMTTS